MASPQIEVLTREFLACRHVLESLVRRILRGPEADVQDAVQDVWVKAAMHARACRDDDRKKWMCAIAYNHALGLLRKRRVRRRHQSLNGPRPIDVCDRAPSALQQMLVHADAEAVRLAVVQLPLADREAIRLVYFEDESVINAALALDAGRCTLSTRLRRARTKLRISLKQLKAA